MRNDPDGYNARVMAQIEESKKPENLPPGFKFPGKAGGAAAADDLTDDDDEEEEEEEAEEDCVSCTDAPVSCADAPPVQQLPSPPQARSRVRALARRGRSSGETPRPSQATPPSAPPPASSSAPKPAPSWWELVCSTSAPDNRADASERGPRRKKRSASTPASMIL